MSDFEKLGVKIEIDDKSASSAVDSFTRQFKTATDAVARNTRTIRNAFSTIRSDSLRSKFFDNLERESARAASEVRRNAQQIRIEIDGIGRSGSRLSNIMSGFVGGLAAGAFQSVVAGLHRMTEGLTDAADSAALIEAKMRLATNGFGSFSTAMSDVVRISNETRTRLSDTAQLYYKVSSAAQQMGFSQGQVATVVTNFQKALKVSGASAEEASSAILQFSQAIASGKLQGDEFKSLGENADRFMRLLSESLGVAKSDLKKLASEGKITSQTLVKALSDPKFVKKLEAEFGTLPVTFGDIKTAALNMVTQLTGSFAKGFGISDSLAVLIAKLNQFTEQVGPKFQAFGQQVREVFTTLQPVLQSIGGVVGPILSNLVNNLGSVARVALVAAAGFTVFKAATIATNIAGTVGQLVALERALGASSTMSAVFGVAMKGVQSAINRVTVALAANPITAIAVAITVAAVALYEFSDKIKLSTQGMATLADWGNELMSRLGPAFKAIGDIASKVFTAIGDFAHKYLGPIGDLWDKVTANMEFSFAGFIRFFAKSIDFVINNFRTAVAYLISYWSGFPSMLQHYMAVAVNGAAKMFEDFINGMISGINTVSDYLGLGTIGNVNLGRVKDTGLTIGTLLGDSINAGLNARKRTVEDFTDSLQAGAERRARARKAAEGQKKPEATPAASSTPKPSASADDTKKKRKETDKYAETIADLEKEKAKLAMTDRQVAIAEALGRAGLKEDPNLIGKKADAIRKLVNAVEDGKAIKTLSEHIRDLRTQMSELGMSQREAYVSQELRNAGVTKELEELAKLNPELAKYIAQLKEQAGITFDAKQKKEAQKTTQQYQRDFTQQRGEQQARQMELNGNDKGAEELRRQLQLQQTINAIRDAKKENAQLDDQALIAQATAISQQDAMLSKQERMNAVADKMSNLLQDLWSNPREAMRSFLKELIAGLIKAVLKATILNALMPGSGGTIGGNIKSFLGGLFGGGKAVGGSVEGGKYYLVGERGPEIVRMGAAGRVFPNHRSMSGGGTGIVQNTTINFHASGNRQQDDISLAKLKSQQAQQNAQIRTQAAMKGWN